MPLSAHWGGKKGVKLRYKGPFAAAQNSDRRLETTIYRLPDIETPQIEIPHSMSDGMAMELDENHFLTLLRDM